MQARPEGVDRSGRILLAFVAVALVLRLPGHLNSGLWFDEIWLLRDSVRVPLGTLLTTFESDNNHPLYSLAAWLSTHVLGEAAWSLRLPAVLFGAASIGMMWRFADRVAPRQEALLATVLLTLSYHHVWFSQNARGYTMLLFWTLAATHFLVLTYRCEHRHDWIAYGICMALATYTHASAVLVALGQGAVSLLVVARDGDRSGEARWAPVLGLLLAGAVSLGLHATLLSDMLAFFGGDTAQAAAQQQALGPSEWTSIFWTIGAVIESVGVPVPLGVAALAAAGTLVGVGLAAYARRDRRVALLFVVPALLSVVTTVAMGRSLRPRFLFHFAGFALLIVVAGLFSVCDRLAGRAGEAARPRIAARLRAAAGLVAVAASLAILPKAYTLPKQDFEGALLYADSLRADGAVVATVGLTTEPYRDYYEAGLPEIDSTEALDRLVTGGAPVYVLHTLPIYVRATDPALAARLDAAPIVRRFRGSLGDGDVLVLELAGPSGR